MEDKKEFERVYTVTVFKVKGTELILIDDAITDSLSAAQGKSSEFIYRYVKDNRRKVSYYDPLGTYLEFVDENGAWIFVITLCYKNRVIKGFKAFNKDLISHSGFQYEIGKEYHYEGTPVMSRKGFHYSKHMMDCLISYQDTPDARICMVEGSDIIVFGRDEDKKYQEYCTTNIKIIKEVDREIIEDVISYDDNLSRRYREYLKLQRRYQ